MPKYTNNIADPCPRVSGTPASGAVTSSDRQALIRV